MTFPTRVPVERTPSSVRAKFAMTLTNGRRRPFYGFSPSRLFSETSRLRLVAGTLLALNEYKQFLGRFQIAGLQNISKGGVTRSVSFSARFRHLIGNMAFVRRDRLDSNDGCRVYLNEPFDRIRYTSLPLSCPVRAVNPAAPGATRCR